MASRKELFSVFSGYLTGIHAIVFRVPVVLPWSPAPVNDPSPFGRAPAWGRRARPHCPPGPASGHCHCHLTAPPAPPFLPSRSDLSEPVKADSGALRRLLPSLAHPPTSDLNSKGPSPRSLCPSQLASCLCLQQAGSFPHRALHQPFPLPGTFPTPLRSTSQNTRPKCQPPSWFPSWP